MIQTMSKGSGLLGTSLFGLLQKAVFGASVPGLPKKVKPIPLIHAFGTLSKRKVTPKMIAVRERKAAQRQRSAAAQCPVFPPPSGKPVRTPWHPRDADGRAITLVGQEPNGEPRRIWLGGISAQRGY